MKIGYKFMTTKQKIFSSALLMTVVACGKKPVHAVYNQLPKVPTSLSSLDDNPANGDASVGSGDKGGSACTYWDSLPTSEKPVGSFQYFEKFDIVNNTPVGVLNMVTLPQALFGLSLEYNNGKAPLPDVWNFDNFYDFAVGKIAKAREALQKRYNESKDEAEKKQIQADIKALDKKKSDLDIAKKYPWIPFFKPREKALVARNEGIIAELETQLPGAFLGKAAPLTQSPFLAQLAFAMGSSTPNLSLMGSNKARLVKRVPLFLSSNWATRRYDLQRALGTLRTENEGNPTPLTPTEMLCRHLVAQRTMAQILDLKGMDGVPGVSMTDGRLAALPTSWDVPYSSRASKKGSAYTGTVISQKWIETQLSQEGSKMQRMAGTQSSEQFYEALRFWLALASHRLTSTWQSGKNPSLSKLNISPLLLKMSFGLMGIHLNILSATEVTPLPAEQQGPENGYLRLREDSADNLARVILGARELLRGLSGLKNESDFGNKVLSPDQVMAIIGSGGVLDKFKTLRTGATLEGLIRMRRGQGSETLGDVLSDVNRP